MDVDGIATRVMGGTCRIAPRPRLTGSRVVGELAGNDGSGGVECFADVEYRILEKGSTIHRRAGVAQLRQIHIAR